MSPAWTAVLGLILFVPSGALAEGFGTPTMDGLLSPGDVAIYNAPEGVDSPSDPPQGNANMNLGNLYVANDANFWYFLFTVEANVQTTNWGKYLLFIDTTNDANGGTTDAWGRNIVISDPHKAEYTVRTWVDNLPYGTDDTQFWEWNQGTTSWTENGDADGVALSVGTTSGFEWKIDRTRIGNPGTIWVEVASTGGTGTDNAQDTINDPAEDWNATDWTTTATILNSTRVDVQTGVDTTPPTVVSAELQYLPNSPSTTNRLFVTFSEPVDPATAQTTSNYHDLGGRTISSAVLTSATTVRLVVSPSYGFGSCEQMRVTGVRDLAVPPNTIVDNGTTNVANFYAFQLFVQGNMGLHMIAHPDSVHTFAIEGGRLPLTWDPLCDLTLEDLDGDSTYTRAINFTLPCSTGTGGPEDGLLEYKFTHQCSEYETVANHTYTFDLDTKPSGVDSVDIWWNDIAPSNLTDKDIDVVFRVQGQPLSPFVAGDSLAVAGSELPLTWDAAPPVNYMADNGVAPDSASGDGIYTSRLTFPMGTVKDVEFKFLLNALADSVFQFECQTGQPNRSFFLNDSLFSTTTPLVLDVAYFDDCNWAGFTDKDIDVVFTVRGATGSPFVAGDSLAVAGSQLPLTWDTAPPANYMADDGVPPDATSGDGIYSTRLTFPAFTLKAVDFKFLLNAAADSVFVFECQGGAPNRNVVLNDSLFSTTNPIVLDLAYFDDCNWATGVEEIVQAIFDHQLLEPSHPNPLRSSAVISYALPKAGPVRLDVYDVRGRHVRTLVDEVRPAGRSNVVWNGHTDGGAILPNGVYFYRLVTTEGVESRKLVLMR